ncbi:MAG: hypothetical protein AAGD10_17770 [Myxococcota bacterium]
MKRTTLKTSLFGLVLLAMSACGEGGDCGSAGDGNFLDGSFCEFADGLDFDATEVALFPSANTLSIQYGVRDGEDVSARLDIQVIAGNLQLESGTNWSVESGTLFVRRRSGSAQTFQNVSLVGGAGITLDQYGGIGQRCRGSVDFLISSQGSGGTRETTLTGEFNVRSVVDGEAGLGG